MSNIFNSQSASSSGAVTQSQLTSALNKRVAKTQLTTTGAANGVMQVDASGNVNAANVVAASCAISGGSIDNCTIGYTTPSFSINTSQLFAQTLAMSGVMNQYNGIPLNGQGIPVVIRQFFTSALNGNVLSFTPTLGLYQINVVVDITAWTSGNNSVTLSYYTPAGLLVYCNLYGNNMLPTGSGSHAPNSLGVGQFTCDTITAKMGNGGLCTVTLNNSGVSTAVMTVTVCRLF